MPPPKIVTTLLIIYTTNVIVIIQGVTLTKDIESQIAFHNRTLTSEEFEIIRKPMSEYEKMTGCMCNHLPIDDYTRKFRFFCGYELAPKSGEGHANICHQNAIYRCTEEGKEAVMSSDCSVLSRSGWKSLCAAKNCEGGDEVQCLIQRQRSCRDNRYYHNGNEEGIPESHYKTQAKIDEEDDKLNLIA